MKDLVIVAADKSMQQTLKGLLARPQALGIREVEVDIYYHPQHDPACALRGVEFMSDFSDQYHHGLLMFDHQEAEENRLTLKSCKKLSTKNLPIRLGETVPKRSYYRPSLKCGYGVIRPTLVG